MNPFEVLVNGWPIIPVIMGSVEYAKKLGLQGKALTGVSLVLGLAIGGGYYLSVKAPASYADWYALVIGGLAYGLVASGVYDLAKSLASKARE